MRNQQVVVNAIASAAVVALAGCDGCSPCALIKESDGQGNEVFYDYDGDYEDVVDIRRYQGAQLHLQEHFDFDVLGRVTREERWDPITNASAWIVYDYDWDHPSEIAEAKFYDGQEEGRVTARILFDYGIYGLTDVWYHDPSGFVYAALTFDRTGGGDIQGWTLSSFDSAGILKTEEVNYWFDDMNVVKRPRFGARISPHDGLFELVDHNVTNESHIVRDRQGRIVSSYAYAFRYTYNEDNYPSRRTDEHTSAQLQFFYECQ